MFKKIINEYRILFQTHPEINDNIIFIRIFIFFLCLMVGILTGILSVNFTIEDLLVKYGSFTGAVIGVIGSFIIAFSVFRIETVREKKKEKRLSKEKRNFVLNQSKELIRSSKTQINYVEKLTSQLKERKLQNYNYGKSVFLQTNLDNLFSIDRFELYKIFVEDFFVKDKLYYYRNLIATTDFLRTAFEYTEKQHINFLAEYRILQQEFGKKYKILDTIISEMADKYNVISPITNKFEHEVLMAWGAFHQARVAANEGIDADKVCDKLIPVLKKIASDNKQYTFSLSLFDIVGVFNNILFIKKMLSEPLDLHMKYFKTQRLRLCAVIKYYEKYITKEN